MPLRVRFVRAQIDLTWRDTPTKLQLWSSHYRPPLHMILILCELAISLSYTSFVLIPAQLEAYRYREVFKAIFFLEDHEAPISRSSDLSTYYADLNESALSMKDGLLMNVTFPEPMSHTITYSNGTVYKSFEEFEVNAEDLKDIVTILTQIPVYIYEYGRPGCSKWTSQFKVSDVYSNPAFWLSSTITRSHCPRDQLFGGSQHRIPFYKLTLAFVPKLIVLAGVHLLLIIYQLVVRWRQYKVWRENDPDFHDLKSGQMFHYSIGNWRIFELFMCCTLISGSSVILYDAIHMTEMPGLLPLQIYALTTMFLDLAVMQFFRINTYTYHYVAILSEGCVQLFDVAIGFLPVICAFFLAGIFIFCHIAPKTRSVFSMLEILVSFTLGDNIQPTYNEFSDGTSLFNWLAFTYITLFVLAAGWVVFASFTATIAFVDQKLLMKKKYD